MRRTMLALLTCLLVAAGCSSERSPSASSPTTEADAPDTSFGDLDSPCGDGDASGATDVGVTDAEIRIGYGDDAGFAALPGGGHEMSDAVHALIGWCNEQGGIDGRTIVGTYYDAKVTEINNAVLQACEDDVFMLVGEGWALDSAQEQTRLGCGLPAFPTYAVSPQFANAPLMVAAQPNPVDRQPVGLARWYADTHPAKAKKVGTVAINFAASIDTREKQKSTWPKVGMGFIGGCDVELQLLGEADYKPFAKRLQDCGAEVVSFIATPHPVFENFLEAADQLGYHPDYLAEGNFYDQQFARWNVRDLARTTYVRIADVPLEHAAENEATADYVRIVRADGGDVSGLGIHAASAFLLWATAVDACGDALTRECVLAEAATIHDWDGGGLAGPADSGGNLPSTCEVVVRLDGTRWVQVFPEQPGTLHCDQENVQAVTGQVVEKVKLGPDRRVHEFEPE
jgi:ABC-type branched-subunit amino acid transport system substrate-binding protein